MKEGFNGSASRMALIGSLGVVAAMALPSSASAQSVCIPLPGVTNCTVTGPQAPTLLPSTTTPLRVTVTPALDLTSSLAVATLNGVTLGAPGAVSSSLPNQPALSADAASIAATVGKLTTTATGSNGTTLVSLAGPTTLNADAITTSGDLSDGALVRAAGNINLSVNVLQTGGNRALGLDLATAPAACVALGAGACGINGTVGTLTTTGPGSLGVLANAAGPTALRIDALQTKGADAAGLNLASDPAACAVLGRGSCGTAFTVGQLLTSGDRSPGVLATIAGPTTGSIGLLQTSGANAPGLTITGDPTACVLLGVGGCTTNVAVDRLRTAGVNSAGVLLNAPANLSATLGDVATQGDNSPGIATSLNPAACAVLGSGNCGTTIMAGDVTTAGNRSSGIGVLGSGPVSVVTGPVSTAGQNAPGVSVVTDPTACLIVGTGLCPTTVTTGPVQTRGDTSPAVGVTGAGPVTVGTGAISTAGVNSPGLTVATSPAVCAVIGVGSCATVVNSGGVTTLGNGSPGIGVVGSGPTTVTTGPVSTAGANAPGVTVATDPAACLVVGNLSCTTRLTIGPVQTGGNGSPGIGVTVGGPTTIATGPITTGGTGSPGLSVTIDPATCAILGAGSCATTIATGPISTGGSSGIVVAAGGTSGGGAATGGGNAGPIAIAAGPIGAGGNGVDVNVGCQDVDITARGPINAGGTGIVARSQCGVRVTTLPGAPVQGATGGIGIVSGTAAAITVGDRLSAGNGLALDAKGAGATILIQPTGTIVGRVDLTDNADQFTNAGRFEAVGDSNFGGGADLFVNTGTIAVRPAATAPGSVSFAGLEALNNSGVIDLRNGQVGDRLVVPGSFAGTGASTLGVDVGVAATDRLVIGGAATGSTIVLATGLTGALLAGTVVVDAGAGTSARAFQLAGGTQRVGLTDYALSYDAGSNDFAIVGTPDQAAVAPIALADALRQSFYRSSDAVATHLDELSTGRALWMNSYGSVDTRHVGIAATPFGQVRTYGLNSRQDWFGVQGGVDLTLSPGVLVGVTGGYTNSRLTLSTDPSRFSIEAVNAGGYARIAPGPFRLDALGKYEHAWVGFRNAPAGLGARLHPGSYGGRAQASLIISGRRVTIEPFASLDYAHVDRTGLILGQFVESIDTAEGLRGKAGARVNAVVGDGASRVSLYASGAAVHEFGDRDQLTISNAGTALALFAPVVPTYAQVRAGIDITQGARVHGFIEGTADAASDYYGGGGRVGLAVRF